MGFKRNRKLRAIELKWLEDENQVFCYPLTAFESIELQELSSNLGEESNGSVKESLLCLFGFLQTKLFYEDGNLFFDSPSELGEQLTFTELMDLINGLQRCSDLLGVEERKKKFKTTEDSSS